MRALSLILLTLTIGGTALAGPEAAGTPAGEVKVVFSEPIRRQGRDLATVGYAPLKEEGAFLKKVNEPEIALWGEIPGGLPPRPDGKEGDKKNPDKDKSSKEKPEPPKSIPSKDYRLTHCDGRYAGWFGILREVRSESGRTTWLVELRKVADQT